MARNIETREGYEFWDRLNSIPRFAFLLSLSGNSVEKVPDVGGWIDIYAAQVVVDDAQAEVNELRENNAKIEAEVQALREEVAALRAMVVVVPGRAVEYIGDRDNQMHAAGFNFALRELARLNDKGVSEAELAELRRDAERYRWVKQRAWYVDRAACVYEIDHIKVAGFTEAVPVDDDDVEAAIDKAMADEGLLDEGKEPAHG